MSPCELVFEALREFWCAKHEARLSWSQHKGVSSGAFLGSVKLCKAVFLEIFVTKSKTIRSHTNIFKSNTETATQRKFWNKPNHKKIAKNDVTRTSHSSNTPFGQQTKRENKTWENVKTQRLWWYLAEERSLFLWQATSWVRTPWVNSRIIAPPKWNKLPACSDSRFCNNSRHTKFWKFWFSDWFWIWAYSSLLFWASIT